MNNQNRERDARELNARETDDVAGGLSLHEATAVLPEIISTGRSRTRGQNPFDCATRFEFAASRWVAG